MKRGENMATNTTRAPLSAAHTLTRAPAAQQTNGQSRADLKDGVEGVAGDRHGVEGTHR